MILISYYFTISQIISLPPEETFSIKSNKHKETKIILSIIFGEIKLINENRNYNHF